MMSANDVFVYSKKDIFHAYEKTGLSTGKTVYVTGHFGRSGRYEVKGKTNLLNAHYSVIKELIGKTGTLVVPTHSWSLCNTNKPFQLDQTPSETGIFTEFIRQKEDSIRQMHPFASLTANGDRAKYLCENNTRHAYGPHSPFARMIEDDALYVSVGKEIETTASIVHHLEFMMGVPYRYVKEFMHPCIIKGMKTTQPWYLYVLYKEIDAIRDRNKKIFDIFRKKNTVYSAPLGNSFIETFSMKEFYQTLTEAFSNDLYLWLREEPYCRPYQT